MGHGLPDESRAGRQLLKDYTAGRLIHCLMPPGVGGCECGCGWGWGCGCGFEGAFCQGELTRYVSFV